MRAENLGDPCLVEQERDNGIGSGVHALGWAELPAGLGGPTCQNNLQVPQGPSQPEGGAALALYSRLLPVRESHPVFLCERPPKQPLAKSPETPLAAHSGLQLLLGSSSSQQQQQQQRNRALVGCLSLPSPQQVPSSSTTAGLASHLWQLAGRDGAQFDKALHLGPELGLDLVGVPMDTAAGLEHRWSP